MNEEMGVMMIINRIGGLLCLFTGVLILVIAPFPAFAQLNIKELPGNIHLGPVRIHPQFSVKEEYTDNYFLEHLNKKENWITVLTPGITIQVPFMTRHIFQFDYSADIFRLGHFTRYDTEDHYTSGLFKFNFPWGLELNIGDQFIKSSAAPLFEGNSHFEYFYNEGMVEAVYRFADRYKVKLAYRNDWKDFWNQAAKVDNYKRNEVAADIYYRFLPKTSVLVEYTFYRLDNEDIASFSTDNNNHQIWVGLEWEPGAKIKGGIKGGYILRTYDERGSGKNEGDFGMRGDLTYFIGKSTTLNAVVAREIIQTEVTAGQGPYGTHYIETGGTLSLNHNFTSKITAHLAGFYYNDDYRDRGAFTERRMDNRYGGGVGIGYQFRDWLGFRLNYRYTENTSNFEQWAYRENRVFIQAYLSL
jgi:predicted porin